LLVILEPSWSEVLQISGSLDFIESENDWKKKMLFAMRKYTEYYLSVSK
jgi:hypothetical protein